MKSAALEAGVTAAVPRSPHRVMQLLEVLASAPEGVPLAQLSRNLDTPKSSLLNLLRALEQTGYVESAAGGYRVGTASLRLGAMLTGGNPFLRSVRHLLRRLAQDTGETALIGVLSEDRMHAMPVESVESRNPLRFAVPVGRMVPLYCSTLGRAILAFSPDAFITDYLSTAKFEAFTPHTRTAKADILDALAAVRRTGVAEAHGEMTDGIMGFGAPVFDRHGRVEAAVVAGAPEERARERRDEFVRLVRQTGSEMSEVLGYAGPYPSGSESSGRVLGAL